MRFFSQVIAIAVLGRLAQAIPFSSSPSTTGVSLTRLFEAYDANATSVTPEEIQAMEDRRLKHFSTLRLRGIDPVCIQYPIFFLEFPELPVC